MAWNANEKDVQFKAVVNRLAKVRKEGGVPGGGHKAVIAELAQAHGCAVRASVPELGRGVARQAHSPCRVGQSTIRNWVKKAKEGIALGHSRPGFTARGSGGPTLSKPWVPFLLVR